MREIEFRGKLKLNKQWLFGGYLPPDRLGGFYEDGKLWTAEVYPETIGQFTGFKDIDGKKIFEGDIVRIATNSSLILRVAWGDGKYELKRPDGHISTEPCDSFFAKNWEVIGNIHDNPELLEGRSIKTND